MKSPMFVPAFITVVIVSIFELISFHLYLFYSINNFDMLMHSSGGFLVGMLTLAMLAAYKKNPSYGELLGWGITITLIIGLLWECFELYTGQTVWGSFGYWGDNGMDVVMDTLGGLVAVWYAYFTLRKNSNG